MTMHLPNGANAIVDIRKIEDYCLNPSHPRGRHKASVFRDALDLKRGDAIWLRDALLEAVSSGEALEVATDQWGPTGGWTPSQATSEASCGKDRMDHSGRRGPADIRHLLGPMMSAAKKKDRAPCALDVVALLANLPDHRLARGNVGTVVEDLDDRTVLVEFSDDDGRAYAVVPCLRSDLLTLHYVPEAA